MANESSATRRRTRVSVAGWYLLLTGLSLIILFPVWMTIVRALSEPFIYIEEGQPLYPVSIDWGVFSTAWSDGDLGRSMALTLLVTAIITVFQLVTSVLAAYSFAFVRFPFKNTLFILLLASLLLPVEVTLIANVRTIRELGWLDSAQGLSAPFLASAFGIFLIRQYLLAIPDSLLDAARMDGAGEFRIYWALVLPLCRPILVTLAIFTFMGTWNDFMWPLIVLTDSTLYTLPVALANLLGEHVQDTELMMAGSVLTVLPVLLLFVALQKHYIAGIMLGGMKG